MYFNNEFNKSDNKSNSKEDWITVKGNHIKLKDNESKEEAVKRFVEEKQAKSESEKVTGYKEYDPESAVKFTKPSFEITSDRHETIKNFKTWYKENLQGKSVENPLLGKVFFYGRGLSETTHQNIHTLDNLKYIASIPEVISRSKEITNETLKHAKNKININKGYRITGYVEINKDIRKVEVVILEDQNGNRFYTFDARLNKEISKATPITAGALRKTSIDNTIINNYNSVNENRFYTFDIKERDQRVPAENYRPIDPPQSDMVYNNTNFVNENRFYTFDIREKARSLEAPVQTGSENLTYNSYDTHRLSFVNSFELNLYVTETDFRLFEINF